MEKPLSFLITYQQFFVPVGAVSRPLPRIKINRAGSLPHLPLPNFSSAGRETLQMPSPHSNPSPAVSTLSWKIARYGCPSHVNHSADGYSSERRQTNKRLNLWHPGSKRLLTYSVHLPLRMTSRRNRGERSWNGKIILQTES